MKKILLLLLTAFMIISFVSCDEDQVFRYDMGSKPRNLDPQMAYDTSSQIILKHVMQGLVKEDKNGNIICDAAKDYKVSENNTVYTFTLKDNLKWSNGKEVTANDFVFGLKRIFSKETSTPNKSAFLCIKNAQEVLDGIQNIDQLGVCAVDDNVLKITLSKPNPSFLRTLTTAAAYPCNSEFFYSTNGRYGYDVDQLIFNGPFVIKKSSDNYVQLTANRESSEYQDKKDTIIVLYTSSEYNKEERFLTKVTDFAQISLETQKQLNKNDFESYEYESLTWVIGFNQNNENFKNQNLRKAMFSAISNILPNINGYPRYEKASGLIVPSIKLDFSSYRSISGNLPIEYTQDSVELLNTAMKELQIESLGKITILCPDNEIFKYYITYIQKAWQEKLGIIVNFVAKEESEYYKQLYSGDFDLAIFPVLATENSVTSQLEKFSSNSNYNYIYYEDENYQTLLNSISEASSYSEIARLAFDAEKHLVNQAVIIPLVYEKNYLAVKKTNADVYYSPYGPIVDFTNAYKK